VTAYSPYQAYPGPAPVLSSPPPILVAAAEPAPQRRVTVFFRFILAIPHFFVLYWLYFAAGFVLFVGWWGALFTGRLPQFAVTYMSGLLRWATRVNAYYYLLTDVYPPFTFDDDPSYPVRVAIPEPQRLNRFAVFFRYILVLPAALVAGIAVWGASTLMAFIAWLITLVAGQLPPSLYLAYLAVIRFQTRCSGYLWMLTEAYPGGVYGDKPGAVAWADGGHGAPQGYDAPQGYGAPQGYDAPQGWGAPQGYDAPQGWGAPQGYDAPQGAGAPQGYGAPAGYGPAGGYGAPAPGYGAPAGYGAPGGYGVRALFQPETWLLPLTSAAKKLVTTFIAIGALVLVGYVAFYVVVIGSVVRSTDNNAAAIERLGGSYVTLTNNLNSLDQAASKCAADDLACVTKQDGKAATAFSDFSAQAGSAPVPASAAADKARLIAAATASSQDYLQLSKAASASQYNSTFGQIGLQKTVEGFDQDFTALMADLTSQ
jgi:hypothetical protein